MKKFLTPLILILVLTTNFGCATTGPQELTKQQSSMMLIMEKTMDMQTAIQTELAKKNDCSFSIMAIPGREVENVSSINFHCNNSSRDGMGREMAAMVQSFAKVMTYSPAAEISKYGFKALTTLGLAGLGAWTVTNNQDNWADAVNSANSAWGGAIGEVAANNLHEITNTTTTTTSDISDTFSEHVSDTVTTSEITNNYVDTFGIGNTWGDGDWGYNPFVAEPL